MTNAPVNRRTTWIGAGLIILILALTIIAINPLHDFPVEDDWDYSRMVKIFHDTGVLQRSDYAQATLIFPALYGGLVSNLFGFSFTNLRLSTLVLALVTLLAFYVLLGELKLDVPRRIIGTLTLLVAPIFIYLAFSFMTDVPALCWLTLAILFYVRALKRNTLLDALIGSCCAAFMFLTRQTGAFVPVAFGLIVLLRLPRWSWIKFLGAGVVPAAAVIALYLLFNRNSTDNWATQNITLGLTVSQLAQPEWWGIFLRRAVQSLMTISLYLTPLFAALLIGMNLNAGGLQEKFKSNRLRVVVLARGRGCACVDHCASWVAWRVVSVPDGHFDSSRDAPLSCLHLVGCTGTASRPLSLMVLSFSHAHRGAVGVGAGLSCYSARVVAPRAGGTPIHLDCDASDCPGEFRLCHFLRALSLALIPRRHYFGAGPLA